MTEERDPDDEVRSTLSETLSGAVGRYPSWGSSPQAQRALEAESRSRRSLRGRFGRKPRFILAFMAVVAIVVGVGFVAVGRGGGSSPAGGLATDLWAVAAFGAKELVAVGGTDDTIGDLVVARSGDEGRTWSISHPGGPALTTLSVAGTRLIGAAECQAQRAGSGALIADSPASCLYESTDGGRYWRDLGVGRIVDPSFIDQANGFAHSPIDVFNGDPSRLYVTTDGGRTWRTIPSPCDPATPFLLQAVAIGPTAADVLCAGGGRQVSFGSWEIVEYRSGSSPVVLARAGGGGVAPDMEVFRFAMRPSGEGLTFGDQIYRTIDGGATWVLATPASARVEGGGFTADSTGYFVVRNSGIFTGVATTNDGGLTWRELQRWPFFGP